MANACDENKESCTSTGSQSNEEHCEMSEKLLSLADEAWREVLKDKIKQEIEKSSGAKLAGIAKIVTEGNHQRWSHLIQGKQKCEQFKQQLKEALFSLTQ